MIQKYYLCHFLLGPLITYAIFCWYFKIIDNVLKTFNKYKSIADVLQEFPLTYKEKNFIEQVPMETDPYFKSRLDFILEAGVVFNSEYAICESIIYPVLVEVWRQYASKLLLWSHQPLNYDENLSGIPDYMVAQRSSRGKIILEKPYLIILKKITLRKVGDNV